MYKYRLWIDTFDRVTKYGIPFLKQPPQLQQNQMSYQPQNKRCECLKFVVEGEIRDTFLLTEIDSLTTGYKNEEDFFTALEKNTNGIYKKKTKAGLLVTYQYRNEIKQTDIVYNSHLLQKYAILERKKSKKDSTKLKDTEELQRFCVKLLRIVEEKSLRNYVLHPLSLGNNIEESDKKKLSQYLPQYRIFESNDLEKYRRIYDNQLYYQLEQYAKSYDAKVDKVEKGFSTLQEDEALIQTQKKVYNTLKKDYRTLRSTILFMQTYERIREKEKLAAESIEVMDGQLELFSDSNHSLYILDPYTKKIREENQKIEAENADILAKLAYERNEEWQRKYRGEENVIQDGYSFEEREEKEEIPVKAKEFRRYG